jgi:hypothetical protein
MPAAFLIYSQLVMVSGVTANIGNTKLSPSETCITYLGDLKTYQSSTYQVITGDDPIPISANGLNYCVMTPIRYTTNGNPKLWDLFGYNELLIKEGDCAEGIYCSNGKIEYTQSRVCDGNVTNAPLQVTGKSQTLRGPRSFNNVSASFVMMQDGSISIKWKDYAPTEYLVPLFKEPWEIMGLMFAIMAQLVLFASVVYYLIKHMKFRRVQSLASVIQQCLWLVSSLLYVVVVYHSFEDGSVAFKVIPSLRYITRALATLVSALHTEIMLLKILAPSYKVQLACYLAMLALHFGLCGGMYFHWLPYTFTAEYETLGLQDIITNWRSYYFPLWVVILFLFILAPPGLLIYKVVVKPPGNRKGKGWGDFFNAVLFADRIFVIPLAIMLASILLWTTITIVDAWYPILFGGRRVLLSFASIKEFLIALPFLMNVVLLENLPGLIVNIRSVPSKKKLLEFEPFTIEMRAPPNTYIGAKGRETKYKPSFVNGKSIAGSETKLHKSSQKIIKSFSEI